MFRHFMNAKYKTESTDDELNNNAITYTLFDARLLEKSENKSPIIQNLETIMKNCKAINKKSKTLKERFRNLIN